MRKDVGTWCSRWNELEKGGEPLCTLEGVANETITKKRPYESAIKGCFGEIGGGKVAPKDRLSDQHVFEAAYA